MPCSLETVQASLCDSGIGDVESEMMLLRLIAQSAADWVVALTPGTEITVDAIMDRACDSGIGNLDNEIELLRVIAQNLCNNI